MRPENPSDPRPNDADRRAQSTTARHIIDALRDPRSSADQIARVIERDEAIASNLVRLSNSAPFAGRFRVERVRDAVVRLGMATLFNLVAERYTSVLPG